MKNILPLIVAGLLLISCSPKEKSLKEIAIERMTDWRAKNMFDPESYESIEMSELVEVKGKPDSIYSQFLMDSFNLATAKMFRESNIKYGLHDSASTRIEYEKAIATYNKSKKILDAAPIVLNGYTITDRMRAKNLLGGKGIQTYVIHFDKNLKIQNAVKQE